jgi:phosphoribosylformylglycinamidine cyclo-ligase
MSDRVDDGSSMSYAATGVDYTKLDATKRLAQEAAAATSDLLAEAGMREVPGIRGESAYVWEAGDSYWATIQECLGTKALIADEMRSVTGKTYYDLIAKDTVAAIVNDIAAVGARPVVVNAYWAVGDSSWHADVDRSRDLVNGWAAACREAGATWGGGESPGLRGVVMPGAIDLAGSGVGIIKPKKRLVSSANLRAGDAIVLVASNGIHANGLSLARTVAAGLPEGYAAKLPSGITFGESLLRPAHIYSPLVQGLFEAGIDVHYLANITGHGWRKLMRAAQEFTYDVERLPIRDELFEFLMEHSGSTLRDMYGTFNMGAGFAVYVPEADAPKVASIARRYRVNALNAGRVEQGPRRVQLKPLGITYDGPELELR